MFEIRVTAPDGSSRTVAFHDGVCTVGRDGHHQVVLADVPGVSGNHCRFEIQGEAVWLRDLGSRNGTFVNHQAVTEPRMVGLRDVVNVSTTRLEVVPVRGRAEPAPRVPTGAVFAGPSEDRGRKDAHDWLGRIAKRWDTGGRPDRLALRPGELARARRLLAMPEHPTLPVTQVMRDLVQASGQAAKRRSLRLGLGLGLGFLVLAGAAATAVALWPSGADSDEASASAADSDGPGDSDGARDEAGSGGSGGWMEDFEEVPAATKPVAAGGPLQHTVIPEETIDDVARRYGVSVDEIAQWNGRSPTDPLRTGEALQVERPVKRPMPQQKILYEVDPGEESWTKLAARFDVSPVQLSAQNATQFPDGPKAGATIDVWIDPEPYDRSSDSRPLPIFEAPQDAMAIGAPNQGRLENGIKMPESPNYTLRQPRRSWGNAYLVSNLQRAIAAYRRKIPVERELVLADISKPKGGKFKPHASHQAGRDIDVWLPTLQGVFKSKYLNDAGDKAWGRRPEPEEVDWYAAFLLVEALADTGAVHSVFLDRTLHPAVIRAGRQMGATDEDIDRLVYSRDNPAGVLKHSAAHVHHIHVRFKCAPWERECKTNSVRN